MRVCILAWTFVLTASLCQADTGKDVLAEMVGTMAGFKDYKVTVTGEQWVKGPRGKQRTKSSSTMIAKGKKRYSETTETDAAGNKVERVRIFDGNTSWDYDRVKKVVRKVDLSRMGGDVQKKMSEALDPMNLGLFGEIGYQVEEKKADGGRRCQVLTSTEPLKMGQQTFDKVVIWIDAEKHLPVKIEMESNMVIPAPRGETMSITTGMTQEFHDWEIDKGVEDSRFSMAIPQGVEVVDETGRAKEMGEILQRQEEMKKKAEETRQE